ncbi:MAG: terminase family protein [Patescibacteria group bacterium]|nr:terminase family protein [Patescibacteria group bacterium]
MRKKPSFTSRAAPGRSADQLAAKPLAAAGVLLDPQGVPYRPQPRQAVFHACSADVVGYGGAAGGGKSMAILAEAFTCARETPGSYGILFRRSFPELERSLILKSRQMFPREVCKYNEMTHRWTIRPQNGAADSFLDFAFAKTAKEARENYKSAEFNFLGIDEATLNEWDIIAFLLSRSRSSIPGHKPRIVMGTNPGGVGHVWFKEFFGIGDYRYPPETIFTPPKTEDDPEPLSRCFIPAKLSDNPKLSENDPKYRQKLMLLPPNERKMQLDGDWTVFEGRFFPEFTEARHVAAPETVFGRDGKVPKHWKCYRSVDYGFTDPFCCLWFAVAPDGHVYVYRELYLKGLRDKEQVQLIVDNSFEPVEYTTCDPAMKQKNASGVSPYENYGLAGVVMVPSTNERVMGWMAVRNLLANHPDGAPIMRFLPCCKHAISETRDAVHSDDPKRPDDINIHSRRDHAIDTLRYWAVSRPFIPLDPVEDPYRHLDDASRREWEAFDKKVLAAANGDNKAILHGLNSDGSEDMPWD